MRTTITGFAFIEFFRSSIFVVPDMSAVLEQKLLSVRTDQISLIIPVEVYCSVGVIMILLVGGLFFEHGEFHVFFHWSFPEAQRTEKQPHAP